MDALSQSNIYIALKQLSSKDRCSQSSRHTLLPKKRSDERVLLTNTQTSMLTVSCKRYVRSKIR